MSWVDGDSLAEWHSLHDSPSDQIEGLRFLLQIAQALSWLHDGRATPSGKAVVHGDLTPGNVIVNRHNQVVLVDFGLARRPQVSSECIEGTQGYCAPEVLRSGSYSVASDRYAFGALSFFVLTGEQPPTDLGPIRTRIARESLFADDAGLLEHFLAMLAPNPDDRPAPEEWIRKFRSQTTGRIGRPRPDLAGPVPGSPAGPAKAARSGPGARNGLAALLVALGVLLGAVIVSQWPAGGDGLEAMTPTPSPSGLRVDRGGHAGSGDPDGDADDPTADCGSRYRADAPSHEHADERRWFIGHLPDIDRPPGYRLQSHPKDTPCNSRRCHLSGIHFFRQL